MNSKIRKIGIYIWELPYRYGGTESCAIKFAWVLQNIFPNAKIKFVSEVYNKKDYTSDKDIINRLNYLSGLTLNPEQTGLKPVFCSKKNKISRKIMYSKIQNSSKDFDLFFYCSRGNFHFKAKKNIAIIHFPVLPIVREKKKENKFDIPFYTKIKDSKYAKSYDLFLPNSKFSENWLKKIRPDIDSKKIIQLYHPVLPITYKNEKKENAILACSRIEKTKKLEALITAFKKSEYLSQNYKLWIAGNKDKDNPAYCETLQKLAKGSNITFYISIKHEELTELYNKATFFWHSKGFEVNEETEPENLEHFGMTTVEAMSAGCIPIVINKGGQPEIVTEGTGFCWNTLDELIKQTENIAKLSENEIQAYSKSAIKRSKDFNMEKFQTDLTKILSTIL